MAKIDVNVNYDRDITVFKITGVLNAGELLEHVKNCNVGGVTKFILVDFTDASWTGLSAEQLKKNTATAGKYLSKGGKSAFAFSTDADYGIGRMVEAFASIEKHDNEFCMFRSMDEAMNWLKA